MYLKSIEIQGFKSFPDNVEIKLSRGITAIVGPNGSGKSNIVDAVRWVLGEQSTKTLRGGKMEDVIFGGTIKRMPSGYSQVSLTIDNSQGILPIEYSEITVTRRYYRSGESEFYINRKAVRLKDVHELFMDTGLGRDGYSVIGQGRIDEILSVKSGDRREIFEEAAGITKFRYRKEEAEKKLEGTEENLVRIRDIISELEVQIEPLRLQAEKAKRFLILRDEMRTLEISLWLLSLEKLEESQKKSKIDYENADRLLSAKQRELDSIYEELENFSSILHKKDTEIDEKRKNQKEIQDKIAYLQSEIAVLNTNIQNANENIKAVNAQLERDKDKEQALLMQSEQLYKKQDELLAESKRLASEKEELEKKAKDSNSQSGKVVGEITCLNEKITDLSKKEIRVKAEETALFASIAEAEDAKRRLLNQIAGLEEGILSSKDKIKELSLSISEQEEKELSANNVLLGVGLIEKNKEEKLNNQRELTERLQREYNTKLDRLNMLSALEKDYEGFSRAVKLVMAAGENRQLPGILGTVAQVIKTDDRLNTAIEIALGAALQNIAVESEEDGKAAIGYLKSRDGGRATFLPLSSVKGRASQDIFKNESGYVGMAYSLVKFDERYEGIVLNLLGNTLIAEHIDAAIKISRKYAGKVKIVTLDGQVISPYGAMTGGSLNKNTGILARSNECERLKSEINNISLLVLESKASLQKAQSEFDAMKYQLKGANEELQGSKIALSQLNAKLEAEKSIISDYELRKAQTEDECERNLEKTTFFNEELEKKRAELLQIEEEMSAARENAERLESLSKGKNTEIDEMLAEITKINQRLAVAESEKENIKSMEQQVTGLLSELKTEKSNRDMGVDSMLYKLHELENELMAQNNAKDSLKKELEDENRLLESSISEKMELEGRRSSLQKDSQSKNSTILNLERESVRLKAKYEQEELQTQGILDKMWEAYEISPMSGAQLAIKISDMSESQRRLAQIKGEIRALGNVNVLAVEEYEKTYERYSFLDTQRSDLERAKADILKVVSDLTLNMQSTFKAHFAEINESFQNTFREIFGGGSGCLQLEDENDILNCGIEIKVTLPGKTIKTISLLSGGEKAFVAIALYFSILKVRPTPFCILDEIEAALDDVNVIKYITYMRSLCSETQFIVITHRRGTMEGSDILYGVAMQETGVSKLLAINVNEIEEKLGIKE